MGKKIRIRGKRLILLEEISQLHRDLQELSTDIKIRSQALYNFRRMKQELQQKRNTKIKEAVSKKVPMTQIGERLGLSKTAIFLIYHE